MTYIFIVVYLNIYLYTTDGLSHVSTREMTQGRGGVSKNKSPHKSSKVPTGWTGHLCSPGVYSVVETEAHASSHNHLVKYLRKYPSEPHFLHEKITYWKPETMAFGAVLRSKLKIKKDGKVLHKFRVMRSKLLTPLVFAPPGSKCLLPCRMLHLPPTWELVLRPETNLYHTLNIRLLWCPSAAHRCLWWTDTRKPGRFM